MREEKVIEEENSVWETWKFATFRNIPNKAKGTRRIYIQVILLVCLDHYNDAMCEDSHVNPNMIITAFHSTYSDDPIVVTHSGGFVTLTDFCKSISGQ